MFFFVCEYADSRFWQHSVFNKHHIWISESDIIIEKRNKASTSQIQFPTFSFHLDPICCVSHRKCIQKKKELIIQTRKAKTYFNQLNLLIRRQLWVLLACIFKKNLFLHFGIFNHHSSVIITIYSVASFGINLKKKLQSYLAKGEENGGLKIVTEN